MLVNYKNENIRIKYIMPKPCLRNGCKYPNWGGGYCLYDQYLRADKKPKQPKKPKPIKPISLKLSKKLIEYRKLRHEFMIENSVCQAKFIKCCYYAIEVHHRKGRGKYLNAVDTWMSVCRNCHDHIHNNPIEAKEKGFLI